MLKTLGILTLLLAFTGPAYGQSSDIPFTLTAYVGGGYVRNFSKFETPVDGLNQNGMAGSIRIMWKPEYLVSAGLEVDFTQVYSINQTGLQTGFGPTDLTASNNAWPILAVFSMSPFQGVELQTGIGFAISKTSAESFGNSSTASEVGSAFMVSGGYLVPLSQELRLGGEIKVTHINKYDDNNFSLQVVLAYTFLKW